MSFAKAGERVTKGKKAVKQFMAFSLAVAFGASSVINYYEGGKLLNEILTGSKVVYEVHAGSKPEEVREVEKEAEPAKDCHEAIDRTDGPRELMKRISDAEASNDPHQKNPESSASGCFQFVNGTWNLRGKELWGDDFFGKNVYNAQDNADLAAYVIGKYGTSDWDASKPKWSK